MDIEKTKITQIAKADSFEGPRKTHIKNSLGYLCEESHQALEDILKETKSRTFTLLCTDKISGKSLKIGTFKVENNHNPLKENPSLVNQVYENYNLVLEKPKGDKKGRSPDNIFIEIVRKDALSLSGEFTLNPEIAKKGLGKSYNVSLYGLVTNDTVADYKETGEVYGLKPKEDSGLPKGMLDALEKKFTSLQFVLVDEDKVKKIREEKIAKKQSAPTQNVFLATQAQTKKQFSSILNPGDVITMSKDLQQTCFHNITAVIKPGDQYTLGKGDDDIGEIVVKHIEKSKEEIPDKKIDSIIEYVDKGGFQSLREGIQLFASSEISCRLECEFTSSNPLFPSPAPITVLITHCPDKKSGARIVSEDGSIVSELDLKTGPGLTEEQTRFIRGLQKGAHTLLLIRKNT